MCFSLTIYNYIRTGDIKSVIHWLERCEIKEIKELAETSVARAELCHQSEEHIQNLLSRLSTLIKYKDISLSKIKNAAEKEKWIVLYFLKAFSVYNESFSGALNMLRLRSHIIKKRIDRFDAESVIEAEERYCLESISLIADHSLSWDEYMSISYMERGLLEEVVRYLISDLPAARKLEYGLILQRPVNDIESSIIKKSFNSVIFVIFPHLPSSNHAWAKLNLLVHLRPSAISDTCQPFRIILRSVLFKQNIKVMKQKRRCLWKSIWQEIEGRRKKSF